MTAAEPETLVLLHGFAGTHRTWDGVVAELDPQRYRPLAEDLRGHGTRRGRRPIDFPACIGDVLAAAPARFSLCGYSLGGRVALQVALTNPRRVTRLVLIGANPGIEDPGERARRRAEDDSLAKTIEREPIEAFAQRWRAQPLFDGDPAEVRALAVADHTRNDPRELAAVLRGLGAGTMDPLWARLGELAMPALVIAGERDAKFRAIAERTAKAIPGARFEVVPGGHAPQLEAPQGLAEALGWA
jgi:2-succinyl-6-hydroxy-2,4-cyclohexadiene-1-carboxylate synthase